MRGVDEKRVTTWLLAHVAELEAPFDFALIAGGRSNLTFAVTDANGRRIVLRRPPLGHVLATAHDMAREHRIVSAVGATVVPVARTLGLCIDDTVNGAPFYVMEFVDGVVLDAPDASDLVPVEDRRALSEHLIDVLADLHAVDVDAIGLGELARRDGYIERQLRRWTSQWEQSKTRELPELDEVGRRLRQRIPEQQAVCIAHGDYRFGNCLVDVGARRVAAVLDWELCTLGDPLADVGYLGVYWSDPGAAVRRHNDPSGAPGFPTYAELCQRYADRTGFDLGDIGYYVAFSSWRLAVISEGVYARYLHGVMGDVAADVTAFRTATEELATAALAALDDP
jgi:aminoglycoside phosphotransferase (APT) family kinase protein